MWVKNSLTASAQRQESLYPVLVADLAAPWTFTEFAPSATQNAFVLRPGRTKQTMND
jgi:hypothetical protein